MIEGKVKALFSDKERTELLFPITKTSAITNDDGVGLDAIISDTVYSDTNAIKTASVPVNADTLGGKPADEFATQNYVAAEIAKAQLNGGDVDLSGFATKDDVSNAVNGIDFPVDSVNGKTGVVVLSASEVGATPASHAEDKNNPHNVTPAQIGAAPAGYVESVTNAANQTQFGWAYQGKFNEMPDNTVSFIRIYLNSQTAEVPMGEWLATITRIDSNSGFVRIDSKNHSMVNVITEGTWGAFTDISPSAFAPAGYGLGETAKNYYPTSEAELETMLNEILAKMANSSVGFYAIQDNTASIWGGGSFIALVCKTDNSYADVQFYSYRGHGVISQKILFGGIWNPLEWVNPPMIPGNVYRTTKRHGGKPVYTYCIAANIGLEDAGGYKTRWFNHLEAAASMVDIISVKAKVHPIGSNSNQVLPAIGSDGTTSINAFNTGFSIYSTKATNVDYIYAEFEFTME